MNISFLDKIYYRERKKNTLFANSKENYSEWKKVVKQNENFKESVLIFPSAGLGNRLRVMAASWNMAEKLKKRIYFYWNISSDIACLWEDIFSQPSFHWEKNALRFSDKIFCSKKSPHATYDIINLNFQKENIIYSKKYYGKNINIYSCWLRDFSKKGVFTAEKFFSFIYPSLPVKKLLQKFIIPSPKIGLHLRYTDAPIKRNEDWILAWVKYLIKKYPKHEVLVVADNQNLKEKVLEILPTSRACYQKTNLTSEIAFSKDRDSKEGMQTATADLFALASCEFLWSNKPNSSFFQAAFFLPFKEFI